MIEVSRGDLKKAMALESPDAHDREHEIPLSLGEFRTQVGDPMSLMMLRVPPGPERDFRHSGDPIRLRSRAVTRRPSRFEQDPTKIRSRAAVRTRYVGRSLRFEVVDRIRRVAATGRRPGRMDRSTGLGEERFRVGPQNPRGNGRHAGPHPEGKLLPSVRLRQHTGRLRDGEAVDRGFLFDAVAKRLR